MIIYLIFGGIIGWLASIVTRSETTQRVIINLAAGIGGSFIGSVLTGSNADGGRLVGWLGAFAGAALLLALASQIDRRRPRPDRTPRL